MTREEKIRAFAMRLDGMTFEEVAKEFGVTREYIRQICYTPRKHSRRGKDFCCVYPGLKKWMREHQYSVSRLATEIGIQKSSVAWTGKLSGKRNITVKEAKKILAITGLTFEETFGEEVVLGGDSNGCEQQAEGREV